MTAPSTTGSSTDFDAVIIGAGFGGLRALRELRELDMTAHVLEAGSDVGGTWYWNRYPGARTDSASWTYCMSFDDDLLDEWDWYERYPQQAEVLRYLQHVAERFDMYKDIEFSSRVRSAIYDEDQNLWTVTTESGTAYTARYLVTAAGVLSHAVQPNFEGIESFEGETYVTAHWPKDDPDLTGKRIGLVGTGATGVQVLPIVAKIAEQVTVFQRTPNYVLPGRNFVIDDRHRQQIKSSYPHIWEQTKNQLFGFAMDPAGRVSTDVDEAEMQRVLERGWELGGFEFVFSTFDDMFLDSPANAAGSEFFRNKIRAIVEDPETAEILTPDDNHPFLARRPPVGHFYYEAFNRDNVSLVDVKDTPIERITPKGIVVDGVEHEFDVLIFATGFDGVTGALKAMDIRGRDGKTIKDTWEDGPRTYLGTMVDGFPNMFMISGPQTPFANIPVIVNGTVEWIGGALRHMRENDLATMEPKPEVVQRWTEHMTELVNMTVLGKGGEFGSWFLGANIPGKKQVTLFYFGGTGGFFAELQGAVERGFADFTSTQDARALTA